MSYDPIASKRIMIEREIARLQESLISLQSIPAEDTYPDETVIRARIVTRGGVVLTYALLKVLTDGGEWQWYVSQRTRRTSEKQWFTWAELQSWLMVGRRVETWEVMVPRTEHIIVETHDDMPAGNYTFKREQDGLYR